MRLFLAILIVSLLVVPDVSWSKLGWPSKKDIEKVGGILGGEDPTEEIDALIQEVAQTHTTLDSVDTELDGCRDALFLIAADEEKKALIDQRERELQEMKDEREQVVIEIDEIEGSEEEDSEEARAELEKKRARMAELDFSIDSLIRLIRELKDEVIAAARENGTFEKARLTVEQGEQVRNMSFNLELAQKHGATATGQAPVLLSRTTTMIEDLSETYITRYDDLIELSTNRIPAIKTRTQSQALLINDFKTAVQAVMAANQIPKSKEPPKDARYATLKWPSEVG